jgi:hypothetical protein
MPLLLCQRCVNTKSCRRLTFARIQRCAVKAGISRMVALHHSAAEVEAVRALVASGHSLSQIGDRMGITRAAASGIVHRMQRNGIVPRHRTSPPRLKPMIVKPPIFRSQPITVIVEAIPATAVRLTELEGCHWPVGTSTGIDQLFCNAERSGHKSYCRRHAARSIRIDQPTPQSAITLC